MNWIKRIGNALVKAWKLATDKVIEIAVQMKIASTLFAHTVISRLRGLDSDEEPSDLARGIGTLLGLAVLLCGGFLIGQYVGLIGTVGVAIASSAVVGVGVFGHIMSGRIVGLVNTPNLACLGVLLVSLALAKFVDYYTSTGGSTDEAAPVDVSPLHS